MLPAAARLTRGTEITATVRRGSRASRPGITVHLLTTDSAAGPRATVVTPRSVGPAVVRNRVRRRLRHLVRPRLAALPPGATLVVRADARAPGLTSADLAAALDGALGAARSRPPRRLASGSS